MQKVRMTVGDDTVTCVCAKALHVALGVRRNYSHWISDKIKALSLVSGSDYVLQRRGAKGRCKDYFLTEGAALKVALSHQSFRGINTPAKRKLMRQVEALQQALLEADPVLNQALSYALNSTLSVAERATLLGWDEGRQIEAEARLRSLFLLP